MPIIAAAPPQQLATAGGFDYVTVDAVRRRVYAAHTGGAQLMIADADTGKVLGLVTVGHTHGVAVNPETGHVYTGVSEGAVYEIDPMTQRVVNRVSVPGPVDAITYDPSLQRIYADEDDGTRIFVIDAKRFTLVATVALPGHKPEYVQVDARTHAVYQNIADLSEIAVVDPQALAVTRTIQTPELQNNHPLQYDVAFNTLWVLGENDKLSVYSAAGDRLYTIDFPTRIDQCDLDQTRQVLACGGAGKLTLVQGSEGHAPFVLAQTDIPAGVHTLAVDAKTGTIWVVWGNASGAFVQPFTYTR
jgi:DNA-binding beta-propeller fold protein YncE